MANRNFISSKLFSMHAMPVMVTATVQIGATGAVSSFVGSMVQSVTRVSTGVYKIKCQANTNFSRLYHANGTMQSPASGLSGIGAVEVQNAPSVSMAIASGGELTIKCLNNSGVVADPASGSALNILIIASSSSVVIGGE